MADNMGVATEAHSQAVAAAFEKLGAGTVQETAPVQAEPAKAPELAPEETSISPARDEAGWFAKAGESEAPNPQEVKAPPEEEVAAAPEAPKPEEPPAPPVSKYRAPASWSDDERALWGKVPPEAQKAIARREAAIVAGLKEAAPAKELASAFQQVTQPFAAMFQAEGIHPLQAVGSLLQQAAIMRVGEPGTKAKVMAGWIRQFGVPLDVLADEIKAAGGAPQAPAYAPQQQPAPYQYAPPPYQGMVPGMQVPEQNPLFQAAQAEIQELKRQLYAGEIEGFKKDAPFINYEVGEYLVGADGQPVPKTIADEVADYMSLHTKWRPSVPLSLKAAYDFVVSQHPELLAAMQQREAAKKAKASEEAARKAQAAGSSVTSSRPPGGVGVPAKMGTTADAVAAAFAHYAGQR